MAFNALINSIAPTPVPTNWVRPPDWITIVDVPNEVQFLVADVNLKCFSIQTEFTRTTGDIYIDWGDGVVDTISTTALTTTEHVYSTGGTPCSRGYNTFKIRIYGDATCVITNVRQISNFTVTGGTPLYNIGLLEAYYGDNACTTTAFTQTFQSSNVTLSIGTFNFLEYVKFPSTVTWTTVLSRMFNNCVNLYVVIMPISASGLTDVNAMSSGCINLRDFTFPLNATEITTFSNIFQNCKTLRTVSLPTTLNSCTTLAGSFNGCSSIKNITLPSINLCVSLSSTFDSATSLQWIRFTSLPSPVSPATNVALNNAFANCSQLQNVYFPSTCSVNALYNCTQSFFNSQNLKNIFFPTGFNAITMLTAFSGCHQITNVVFPSTMSSLTSFDSCFLNCYNLNSITLPTTVSASSITLSFMFNNCITLPSITIPSGYVINSLSSTFSGCLKIKTIVLPNNSQNSCLTMASMCFNCQSLESIIMPTSLNFVNTLLQIFNGCNKLISVTFPSTMNAVTTMNASFVGNYNLTSVTLPTSMSACTIFNNTFQNCYNLPTVVMPTTISASTTTFSTLVSGCNNLKTLTLPTTQTSLLNSISSFILNCGSLTTINNLNKIGTLTALPLVSGATNTNINVLTSLSFSCPLSILTLNGASATNFSKLNSLRLVNASSGQWTGTSPQINISFTSLSTASLNILFGDIALQGVVTSKTINITSCTGASGLSAADRLVLTSRGWTIIG